MSQPRRYSDEELAGMLRVQREACDRSPYPSLAERRVALDAVAGLLREDGERLGFAISEDFGGRPAHETRLLEIFPSLEEVSCARSRVRRWMKSERVSPGFWFRPGRARIVSLPAGVVGIVVPWNYPLYLSIAPLAGALAAGNRVMIRISERVPRFGEALRAALAGRFDPARVVVVTGDLETSRAFVRLPFDHLLFTGSTAAGREVLRAAADRLTPVTLELGGKCPAIVAPGFSVAEAARRILWGKCLNAGQTCIAPDYALVPDDAMDEFIAAARDEVARLYPEGAASPDYCALVDDRAQARLASLRDAAVAAGATAIPLAGGGSVEGRRFPPTLLTGVTDGMAVMREEIFGPLLPVMPYRSLDEALAFVAGRPKPLSLYYFDSDGRRVDGVLRRVVVGGVTVNDTILHIAQCALPFGGVGDSGTGRYHGEAGFRTFSRRTSVFTQSRFNALRVLKPPYGRITDRLLSWMLR